MKKAIAALLAFLLTGALILFSVTFLLQQIIQPAMDEDGAQVSSSVIREEQQLARDRITKLAGLYGFEAEPVTALITEDTLRDLHSQASLWWSTLLKDGKIGEELRWDTDGLAETLAEDSLLNRTEDEERSENLKLSAAEEVTNSIVHMVLPMRPQTIRLGLQEIEKRVDLPNVIRFFLGVPWAALALCALLAGLIALLESGRFTGAARYIGYALGAAALTIVALMLLYMNAGILPMIREASAGLTIQYRDVVSGTMTRAGILAAVMAAGCILCLAEHRRNGKTV
ncbi:MAG: hypothetical protein K6F61_06055 [Clostridiales bacterium]|nr:hypothetical protein [Clostridiales bacterium]